VVHWNDSRVCFEYQFFPVILSIIDQRSTTLPSSPNAEATPSASHFSDSNAFPSMFQTLTDAMIIPLTSRNPSYKRSINIIHSARGIATYRHEAKPTNRYRLNKRVGNLVHSLHLHDIDADAASDIYQHNDYVYRPPPEPSNAHVLEDFVRDKDAGGDEEETNLWAVALLR
jgi:hypothetical protein